MKKLTSFFLLAAIFASLLAGCGGKPSAAPAQQPDTTPAAAQQPSTKPAATPEPSMVPNPEVEKAYQEILHAYDAVLDEICDTLYNGYNFNVERRYVSSGVIELSTMERSELLQYLGYTYEDVSGDGIPELLIGTIPRRNAEIPEVQLLLGGFTCKDGEPVCFLEGWSRNVYEWLGEGRFFYYASGGWAYSGFGPFHISEDGTELQCEDWYFSDIKDGDDSEVVYFHNTTGDVDKTAAEALNIDADAFWKLSETYDAEKKTMRLTPFADYQYTGFISQPLACKVRVDYFDDVNYQNEYDDASKYMDRGTQYDTRVLFRSEEGVADFKLLSLSLKDVDANGKATFDITEVFSIPNLRAGIPLAVPMSFPGDIPSNGFSYTDKDGSTKAFSIGVSGLDSSLVVLPMD